MSVSLILFFDHVRDGRWLAELIAQFCYVQLVQIAPQFARVDVLCLRPSPCSRSRCEKVNLADDTQHVFSITLHRICKYAFSLQCLLAIVSYTLQLFIDNRAHYRSHVPKLPFAAVRAFSFRAMTQVSHFVHCLCAVFVCLDSNAERPGIAKTP